MVERTLYQWPFIKCFRKFYQKIQQDKFSQVSQNNMTKFINNVQNNAENEIRSSAEDAKTKIVIHIP